MANVLDFHCNEYPQDLLTSIMDHQHELAVKYLPIEKANGLLLYEEMPADIDNPRAQARIKDMSWRTVEEVAEAIEALENGEFTHFYEELADALHFLIEKYLICDFKPLTMSYYTTYSDKTREAGLQYWFPMTFEPLNPDTIDGDRIQDIKLAMADFVTSCGLTCNCLKNKPWKQSQMLTDIDKFRNLLKLEFNAFMHLCRVSGYNEMTLYNMYMRKNQVNQFRQRSNY